MSAVFIMENGSIIVRLSLRTQTKPASILTGKWSASRMEERILTTGIGSGNQMTVGCLGRESDHLITKIYQG